MRERINDPARISLMLEAIANIQEYLSECLSYDSFASNKLLCHAVFYNLQCIGECSYKLSRNFVQEHPEVDWEAIEGLRHVLVHDYYTVDTATIWAVIEKDLPSLKDYLLQHVPGQENGQKCALRDAPARARARK